MRLIIEILEDAYKYCTFVKDEDIDDLGFFTSHILKSVADGIPYSEITAMEGDKEK